MKGDQFSLIGLPGRVMNHARGLIVRLVKNHPSLAVLVRPGSASWSWTLHPSGKVPATRSRSERQTVLARSCEGGLIPIAYEEGIRHLWITRIAEGLSETYFPIILFEPALSAFVVGLRYGEAVDLG